MNFAEWSAVFGGDAKMTLALLDRLTHHCDILEAGNENWRSKTVPEQSNSFTHSLPRGNPLATFIWAVG